MGRMEQRLIFLFDLPKANGNSKAMYRCLCGTEKQFFKNNVSSGKARSCGCLNNEVRSKRLHAMPTFGKGSPTHQMSKSPEYRIWRAMKNRCEREKNDNFKWYGARGIKVCDRWQSFESFYADMGVKPQGLTIDRVDNSKGYEPGNCVWATWKQQANNRRKSEND